VVLAVQVAVVAVPVAKTKPPPAQSRSSQKSSTPRVPLGALFIHDSEKVSGLFFKKKSPDTFSDLQEAGAIQKRQDQDSSCQLSSFHR
jgi:hypothetical protein